MAKSAAAKRLLVVGGLVAALVAAAVVVRAADDIALDSWDSGAEKPEGIREQVATVRENSDDPSTVKKDVNEIDQLLNQSLVTNEQLDKEVAKSNAWKYGAYGSMAALGVGGIGGIIKTIYSAKSNLPQGKKGTALGLLFGALVLGGAAAMAASLVKKAQVDKRVKAKARELLGQRQVMLSKLSKLSDERLDEVLNKAEEIGNIADDLGLYAPELDSVAPAAA